MSYESDTRVVELQFNNKQFEADVSQTIKTLNKLDESLQLDSGAEGFDKIDKAAKKLNFDPLFRNVEQLGDRFTLLGTIQRKVFEEIGDRIMALERKIEGLVKSMSLDQILSGWDKYAEKTSAVQTIMAATANEVEDFGDRMKYVNSQLEMLNWFTDETSHKYMDMVNNIGKFTANQVPLEQAVVAMQGIATWASKSGANAGEAGRAMYNLSQAISSGALRLMDWKSIELANMATAEFKQTAIETAEKLGVLERAEKDVWVTSEGAAVSVKGFRDSLASGWLSSNVLLATLDRYGGFTIALHDVVEETGLLTSQVIRITEEYAEGYKDVSKWAEKAGMESEEFEEIIATLADEEYRFGREAFRAAQEAKTFGEAIDSVKEAVASGWMQTFEIIFGDYQKARLLWTDFAEYLYEVFNGTAEARNEMLRLWDAIGGRDELIQGFRNLAAAIESIIEPIKRAWREFFPETTAARIYYFTLVFRRLTESMIQSEEAGEGIYAVFKLLFTPIKMVATASKIAVGAFLLLANTVFKSINWIFEFIGAGNNLIDLVVELGSRYEWLGAIFRLFGAAVRVAVIPLQMLRLLVVRLIDAFKNYYGVKKFTEVINALANSISNALIMALTVFGGAIQSCFEFMLRHIPTAEQMATALHWIASAFNTIGTVLGGVFHICSLFFQQFSADEEKAAAAAAELQGYIQGLVSFITEKYNTAKNWLVQLFGSVFNDSVIGKIKETTANLMAFFNTLSTGQILALVILTSVLLIARQFRLLLKATTSFVNGLSGIEGVLKNLKAYLFALTNASKYSALIQIGAGLTLIAAALVIISKIDKDRLWESVGALATLGIVATGLVAALAALTKATDNAGRVGLSLAAIGLGLLGFVKALASVHEYASKLTAKDAVAIVGIVLGYIASLYLIGRYVPAIQATAWQMIALAGAIWIMVKSFSAIIKAVGELKALNFSGDQIGQVILAIAGMLAAHAGLILVAKKINAGSGFALMMMAGSLLIFFAAMKKAVNLGVEVGDKLYAIGQSFATDWQKFAGVVAVIAGSLGTMLILIKSAEKISWQFLALGGTLLAGALALRIAFNTIVYLKEDIANASGMIAGAYTIIMQLVALWAMMKIVSGFTIGGGFGSGAKSILALAMSALAIAAALTLLSKYKWNEIKGAVAAFSLTLLAFSVACGIAGSLGRYAKGIKQMTVTIAALVGSLVVMSFFKDNKTGINQLIEPAKILGQLFITLSILMYAASKIAVGIDWKTLGMLALNVVAVGGTLIGLVAIGADLEKVRDAALGLSAAIAAVGIAAWLASKANWQSFAPLLAMCGVVLSIAGAFYAISIAANGMSLEDVAIRLGGLAACVIAVGLAGKLAGNMNLGSFIQLLGIAIVVGSIGGALWLIAQNPWDRILVACLALAACIGIVAGLGELLSKAQIATIGGFAVLASVALILGAFVVEADKFSVASYRMAEAVEKIVNASNMIEEGHMQALVDFIHEFMDKMGEAFQTDYPKLEGRMYEAGNYIVRGFIEGIEYRYYDIDKIGTDLWKRFASSFEKSAGIASPSTYMRKDGYYVLIGFTNGVKEDRGLLKQAADGLWYKFADEFDTVGKRMDNVALANGQLFVDNLAYGIYDNQEAAIAAASSVAMETTEALGSKEVSLSAFVSGEITGEEYVNGILNNVSGLGDIVKNKIASELGFDLNDIFNMSNLLNPRDTEAKWLDAADKYNYEGMRRMGMSQEEAFEKLGYDPYDPWSRQDALMNRQMDDAQRRINEQLGEATTEMEEYGGSAGRAASEMEDLTDVTQYAGSAVVYLMKKFQESGASADALTASLVKYFDAQNDVLKVTDKVGDSTGELQKTLSNKSPYEKAVEATEQLILAHLKYVSGVDDSVQSVKRFGDLTTDQLQRAKEEWEQLAGYLQSAFSDGDMWSAPIGKDDSWEFADYEATNYIDNLQRSIDQRKALATLLEELYTKQGLDSRIIEEIMSKGTADGIKIAYGLSQATTNEINAINKLYSENLESIANAPYDFLLKTGFELTPEEVNTLGANMVNSIKGAFTSESFANGLRTAGADLYMQMMSIDNKGDLYKKMYESGLGEYFSDYIQKHGYADADSYGEMIYDVITNWTNDTLSNWETQIRNLYNELQTMQIVGIEADNKVAEFGKSLWPSYEEALREYKQAYSDWTSGGNQGVGPSISDYYNPSGRTNVQLNTKTASAAINANDTARGQSVATSVGGNSEVNNYNFNQTFEGKKDPYINEYTAIKSAMAAIDRRDTKTYMAELSKWYND